MSHSEAHTFAENCGLQSEVIVAGTPKRVIHWKTRARAQFAAEKAERGIASVHLNFWVNDGKNGITIITKL
jgi:hypothetical protein